MSVENSVWFSGESKGLDWGGNVISRLGFLRWEDAEEDNREGKEWGRRDDIRSLGRWVGGPKPHIRDGWCR